MATIQTDERAAPAPDDKRPPRRSRPRTQYWDYETASWRSGGPIPVPRRGD
jgi:hypothetical protein